LDAIIGPLFTSLLNKYSKEEIKATLFSFNSMITGISTILGSWLFGFKDRLGYFYLSFIPLSFYLLSGIISYFAKMRDTYGTI
jgi:hypothetical protein